MRAARRSLPVLIVIGLTLLWAALAFAAGASTAQAGGGATVEIEDFAYGPAEVTIGVGETVTWVNRDAIEHTATATDGSWDTGLLAEGIAGSITFTAPGTYEYLCTPHPSMTGRVVVVAAPSSPAPSNPAPSAGTGQLPDVAISAGDGSSMAVTLVGTALLGIALLVAGFRAVVASQREMDER